MFDATALVSSRLAALKGELAGYDGAGADDAERIDQLRALEELKAAAAAAQARVTAAFEASQRAEQAAAAGRDKQSPRDRQSRRDRPGQGVGSQVALARRESANRGARHLGFAIALVREMPFTLAALTRGLISEWQATILVRETACLCREDRARVDVELCGDPEQVSCFGDRQLAAEARKLAYRLDADAVVRRARKAQSERRVSIRPAPDTMSYLTALLPVAQGVAVFAALKREADKLVGTGDGRTRGQIMADTLVERVTGQATAARVPVVVNLVMTAESLFDADDEAAHVEGYGPVPAGFARDLVGDADRAWLRRLYTSPHTGELIGMDSRARLFPEALTRLFRLRDQHCRTPWCDAPIRHGDHVAEAQSGGPTSAANGQGLCEACNHAKQALGWRARPRPGPVHTVETVTPTGHTYLSTPPELPGQNRHWIPGPHPGVWVAA